MVKKRFRRVFFDLWYRFGSPPWDTNVSPPELRDFIESEPPGRALDLGCGTGTNAILLVLSGWQVSGVDFSAVAIRAARRKAKAAGVVVDFRRHDVTHLDDFAAPFDLVLDIGCFHGLDEAGKAAYRDNLRRLLAPGGHLLLYAHKRQPGSGMGVTDADLESFERVCRLLKRTDSADPGGMAAVWLLYQKDG